MSTWLGLLRSARCESRPALRRCGGADSAPRRKRAPRTSAYVMVDYFTKAAELAVIPDKRAETVARAFHDYWLARYGTLEWVTSDNGREIAGAFEHMHQLARWN
jgi:hypothetical protein